MATKRRLAVFTIVQHEPFFFPKWLEYYSSQADREDIFVLHHALPDACPPAWLHDGYGADPFNVVPVHNAQSFEHEWLRDTVAAFQRFLLRSYEWVLFAEVDEILTARPSYATLDAFLADYWWAGDAFQAEGYEVVHQPASEPPLERHATWLMQRALMYKCEHYAKTLLSSVPLDWELGFHTVRRTPAGVPQVTRQQALTLVHLHKVDFEQALLRGQEIARRRWSAADVAAGRGHQNRIDDREAMAHWFNTNIDTNGPLTTLGPMPTHIRMLC